MRNRNILIAVGLILLILLSGCTIDSSDKNIIKVDNPEQQLPKGKEFHDYIVDIEDTRYYDDYVLLKYTISTKDGTDIDKNIVHLSIKDKSETINYGSGIDEISTNLVSKDKLEVISQFFIASNSKDFIQISYTLHGLDNLSSKKAKEIDNIYSFKKTNKDYIIINDKKTIDDLNITVESIGNFDFGSLFNFYIEYNNEDSFSKEQTFSNLYSLKVKSDAYINNYVPSLAVGFDKRHIESLSELENIDQNALGISFFYSFIYHDLNSVDLDDYQIYLVNNDTKEETLLYSK